MRFQMRKVNDKAIREMIDMAERRHGACVALGEAVRWSKFDIVKRLLEAGADPNCRLAPNDVTPVFLCCSAKILELLVNNGADLKLTDKSGAGVLMSFLQMHYSKQVARPYLRKLFAMGIEVDLSDSSKTSARSIAMKKYSIDLLELDHASCQKTRTNHRDGDS